MSGLWHVGDVVVVHLREVLGWCHLWFVSVLLLIMNVRVIERECMQAQSRGMHDLLSSFEK